jgi:hypothetical protein
VAGDIKDKVRPGTNKKISWAVAKELAVFDGDMVFKVEAARKKMGYPKPDADGYFSVEATNAYFEGSNLKIEFKITNISKAGTLKAQFKKEGTMILDDQGGLISGADITIANKSYDLTIEFANEAGYKGIAVIKNASQEMTIISLLKLNFYIGKYENPVIDFTRTWQENLNQEMYGNENSKKSVYDMRSYSIKNIPISK